MAILEEFYYGNINPSEKFIKKGGEYYNLSNKLAQDIDKLRTLLDSTGNELYDQIEETFLQLCSIAEKERFIDGFSVGVQMMCDAFGFKSENYI